MSVAPKPQLSMVQPMMSGAPLDRGEAVSCGRTFYVSKMRCASCDTPFRWSHTGDCMTCFPRQGERLGMNGG